MKQRHLDEAWKSRFPDAISDNVRGALWALAATAAYVVVGALVKIASRDYYAIQILFFRQSVMLLLVLPTVLRHFPQSLKTERLGLHLLRLVGAITALLLSFVALAHLPLATATTLSFAKMFFVTLIAVPMLGEVVGRYRIAALVVGFAGVLLMVRPDPQNTSNLYSMVAIVAAAGAALGVVCVRKLSTTESTVTLLSYQAIFIGVLVAFPTYWFWHQPDLQGLLLLLAIGVISLIAQWLGVQAYRAGEASVVTSMEYTKLVYATIIGILVFAEWPQLNTLVGAAIIISAATFTVIRESRRLPENREPEGKS
ncbi:MAG TPA: DMT family transporter [Gammaproteobacteria bacterium]|nr:DMT family transporter [Gammaproteobacteria bacterium]